LIRSSLISILLLLTNNKKAIILRTKLNPTFKKTCISQKRDRGTTKTSNGSDPLKCNINNINYNLNHNQITEETDDGTQLQVNNKTFALYTFQSTDFH